MAPIVWAGFIFGWKGAFITSLAAVAAMLPRAIGISEHSLDAILETCAVFIIGNVIAISFGALRKEREYRIKLKSAHEEQQKITEELQLAQENLRFYLQQATRAQEEERKRISHELHDDTIQALVVLSRELDEVLSGDAGMPEAIRLRLEELWHRVDTIAKGVRRLSQDLRPAALDQLGLLPALEWLAANLTEHSGIAATVKVTGQERRLSEETAIAGFRICQEALRNVWRHSEATDVEILIEFEQSKTRLTIRDNGKGFELPEKLGDMARDGKLGLSGMQERAQLVSGTLVMNSHPGQGTSIVLELAE
ncbi:MAG: sensor histidine kinase [Dehalococcoidales bacterium]|nr:sensor histidine kinase [Dehalococcoidales bacterium]